MGASISSILAILYMHTLESTTMFGQPTTGLYVRYVDDILKLTTDKLSANNVMSLMNDADCKHQVHVGASKQ